MFLSNLRTLPTHALSSLSTLPMHVSSSPSLLSRLQALNMLHSLCHYCARSSLVSTLNSYFIRSFNISLHASGVSYEKKDLTFCSCMATPASGQLYIFTSGAVCWWVKHTNNRCSEEHVGTTKQHHRWYWHIVCTKNWCGCTHMHKH